MNYLKRFLRAFLILTAVVVCLTMLPNQAEAATVASGTCGDNLAWILDDAGTLTISGTGDMDNFYGYYDEYFGYVEGDSPWFYERWSIKSVVIRDGVTSIGNYAFFDCANLTSVTIPDGVTGIGSSAFRNCSTLTSVTIPDSATSIGGYAFQNCTGLTSVIIGNGVESIGVNVFSGCGSLAYNVYDNAQYLGNSTNPYLCLIAPTSSTISSCQIHEEAKVIANYAFSGCASLTEITIPAGVTSISSYAFRNCSSLTEITIPDDSKSISDGAFYGCSGLTSVMIGKSVTSIGYNAFYNCSSLASVTIPDSVTSIGGYAFRNCTGLTSVIIGNGVESISANAFSGCGSLAYNVYDNAQYLGSSTNPYLCLISASSTAITTCQIHENTKSIAGRAFSGCSSLTEIIIPNGVTSIGSAAFENCTGLASVIFGKSVTSIESGAFSNCSSLTSVVLGDSVTDIASRAFYKCGSLTEVSIPDCVTSIGYEAFSGCSSLTDVIIPNSVTGIGYSAFYGCSSLTEVTIPNSLLVIERSVFSGCTGLTKVTMEEGVASIEDSMFSGCTALTNVAIPDSVTNIGGYAFNGCSNLPAITIPSGLKSIGESAFYGCSSLTDLYITDVTAWMEFTAADDGMSYLFTASKNAKKLYLNGELLTDLVIPAGVTSVNGKAFNNCGSLKTVTIPAGVTSIGSNAFENCSNLTHVTMGDSVTSIGSNAFKSCTGLTSIVIPDGVKSIGYTAFSGCTGLTVVSLGNSVCNIGTSAFRNCSGLTQINIPDKVTVIQDGTFYGCSSLTEIIIPNGVTSIGSAAFENCTGLASVIFGKSVTSIESGAFSNCSSLAYNVYDNAQYLGNSTNPYLCLIAPTSSTISSCQIHEDTRIIAGGAFSDCTSLTEISIPDNVVSIGDSPFSGCTNLTDVTIGNGVTSIPYLGCSNLTFISIGNGVTSIGERAFSGYTKLCGVMLPDSVKSIGNSAFSGCTSLGSITIPDSVTSIGDSAFYNCTGLYDIDIGSNVQTIGSYAFGSCADFYSITIPVSVTSISRYAFSGCSNLSYVSYKGTEAEKANMTIQTGNDYLTAASWSYVQIIGSGSCGENLTWELRDDRSLIIAGTGAMDDYGYWGTPWHNYMRENETFYYYDSWSGEQYKIDRVVIKDGVTSIANGAFRNFSPYSDSYSNLAVRIPDSITELPENAFEGCYFGDSYSEVYLGNENNPYLVLCYAGSIWEYSYTIPETTRFIWSNAFQKWSYHMYPEEEYNIYITDPSAWCKISFNGNYSNPMTLSNNVYLHILDANGNEVTDVVLDSSVTQIPQSAFRNASIKSITIPNGVTSIGDYAFYCCRSLTDIDIPDGVTRIGNSAFYGCFNLTGIAIPDTVSGVGKNAFYGITGNTYDNAKYIGNEQNPYLVLASYTSSDTVTKCTVHSAAKIISDGAFADCYALREVTIPNGVISIGSSAFNGTAITSVTIPDSVTSIGSYAFSDCYYLTSVTIGKGVNTITNYMFEYCDRLTHAYYEGTSEQWGKIYSFNGGEWEEEWLSGIICLGDYPSVAILGDRKVPYNSVTEALANADGGYVRLNRSIQEDVTVAKDVYMDLKGYTLTGDVTVEEGVTLYVFDSATADYTADNRGKIVGSITGNLARSFNTPKDSYGHNYKYLALEEEEDVWSFHRYYLTVKSVILQPCVKGEGYIGTAVDYRTWFRCNDLVAQHVTAYGTKLVGDNTVYADYMANGYTLLSGAENDNAQRTWLTGTFKSTNTPEVNAANALAEPTVSAYITLTDGTEITSAGVQRSLQDMIVYANGLNDLTALEKKALGKMYTIFKDVLDTWTDVDISNIKQYSAEMI